MSNEPTHSFIEFSRSMLLQLLQRVAENGTRICSWLVVGNAGAIVIVFNAVIAGSSCDPLLMSNATKAFSVGLIAAFAGAVGAYGVDLRTIYLLSGQQTSLTALHLYAHEMDKLEPNSENLEDIKELNEKIQSENNSIQEFTRKLQRRYLIFIPITLYIISAFAFLTGATLPIFYSEAVSSCRSP
ncbi:hypothetical protein [Caulobacter sp. NIBR2454]|uniref:hypothetical protein n=1 Tax=Caulobacter sp. NIBR2454 TaxID=3015996 RepID=UPI0022B676B3|nr:hypothetical protein [Caulobacter sp. NIBR2454]